MTSPEFASELGERLPSESERAGAGQLRSILTSKPTGDTDLTLRIVGGAGLESIITLTPALSRLLGELLQHVSRGNAVSLIPVTRTLTTQQAADILNVSHAFFVSLLEKGEIPFETVGRHRRVKADDLFAYKRSRNHHRAHALAELAEHDASLFGDAP